MGCTSSSPVSETDGATDRAPRPLETTKPAVNVAVPTFDGSPLSGGTGTAKGRPTAPVEQRQVIPAGQYHSPDAISDSKSQDNLLKAAGDPNNEEHHRKRRQAFGAEVVREQIRRMAVGGPQTEAEKANVYEVSDSDDEDYEKAPDESPADATRATGDKVELICNALSQSIVFRGLDRQLMRETVACMWQVPFVAGSTVLQQGSNPKKDDCLYFLESGEVDVVISGAVDGARDDDVNKKSEGNNLVLRKGPGWVFGDVSLLFNTTRSASVLAASDLTLWAMGRSTFMRVVMKHSDGARGLRFLRRLPLLKGLSDNVLISVTQRMKEETYADGEKFIKYGERGDNLYIIRYGKVSVQVPHTEHGPIEVAKLGRGQLVGERTLVTGKLRSADCVAVGSVRAVVVSKRDFWEMDNPLLAWMMDYDAAATVLKALPPLRGMGQEQLEEVIDRMENREDLSAGQTLLREGDLLEKLYIIKMGAVSLYKHGQPVMDEGFYRNFVKEAGGYTYIGDRCLKAIQASPVTVKIRSDTCCILKLPRRALDDMLGPPAGALVMDGTDVALLKDALTGSALGQYLSSAQIAAAASAASLRVYGKGDVIMLAGERATRLLLVKRGTCLLTEAKLERSQSCDVEALINAGATSLGPGTLHGDAALVSGEEARHGAVAAETGTQVLVLRADALERAAKVKLSGLGTPGGIAPASSMALKPPVAFHALEQFRIVGTGQFGMVRLVRDRARNAVYALKVMHKAPITESKQIEHVINERVILQEAEHQFTVKLEGAFQDPDSLYLLQEWVPGGELFHHLDLEGAFDEATAMFYAANVLVVLEHLHSKNIVYRDLKPENLLLDKDGYMKMADFGFAKKISHDKTYTICGTPDYQAPEVIMRRGTTKAADYWALGVLIFEMLVGDPPFKSISGDPWDTFRRTLSGRFYVPNFVSDLAADLIYKLLQVNPDRRLGSGRRGAEEIKRHRWFQKMDWAALEARELRAPIIPKLADTMDTRNFDSFDSVNPTPPKNTRNDAHLWELWDWVE